MNSLTTNRTRTFRRVKVLVLYIQPQRKPTVTGLRWLEKLRYSLSKLKNSKLEQNSCLVYSWSFVIILVVFQQLNLPITCRDLHDRWQMLCIHPVGFVQQIRTE